MTNKSEKTELVQYNDKYAAGISEMWFISSKSAKAGETVLTKPNFFIFSEIKLDKEMLVDLDGIRFE